MHKTFAGNDRAIAILATEPGPYHAGDNDLCR
jgi:hypothetical protein